MLQARSYPGLRPRRSGMFSALLLFCLVSACALPYRAWAQQPSDLAVQAFATVSGPPEVIKLSWLANPNISAYTIYKKLVTAATWGTAIATNLPGATTSYTVSSGLTSGTPYEFEIVGTGSGFTAYGYVASGLYLPYIENRGKVILVVESSTGDQLTTGLNQLISDLVGDGWTVIQHNVLYSDTVESVQTLVDTDYNNDPTNVKALFLFGNVPIPLSGWLNPDGHYSRPFPTDLYYGIVGGAWTDNQTFGPASGSETNVPNDGKFDQNTVTDPYTAAGVTVPANPVTLEVGRVDLSNMSTFPDELANLSNYLTKDHNYRIASYPYLSQGYICDNFGYFGGEAFAQNGWRDFAPFFPPANGSTTATNLVAGVWTGDSANNFFFTDAGNDPLPYLWGYGCGGGSPTSFGSPESPNGEMTTTDMLTCDPAIFTMLFGSYFGEWNDGDDLMRGELCTPNYGLTCSWAGRPNWFYHHMGIGYEIGYSARLSENNTNSLYQNTGICAGELHVNLMGDPTLRLTMVPPPQLVTAQQTGTNAVTLNWSPPIDANGNTVTGLAGYAIYRVALPYGPATRIGGSGTNFDTQTTFTDTSPSPGANNYMVRAVLLETSTSSSYYNASEGAMVSINAVIPVTGVTLTTNLQSPRVVNTPIKLTATTTGGMKVQYQFWVENTSTTTWTLLQAYSSTATCTWTPTTPGSYQLYAYAQDTQTQTTMNTMVPYSITSNPLTAVRVSPSPAAPQPFGAPVTLTASTTGGANLQYQFWVYQPTATPAWNQLQVFSSTPTCTWTPSTPGSYLISCTALDGLTEATASYSFWYTVSGPALTSVTVTTSLASPQQKNTPITLSAAATGGTNVQYQFWVFNATNPAWTQLQGYSSTASCLWTPATAGQYLLSITALDGSVGTNANTTCWFSVTNGAPLTAVTLSTSLAAPQEVDIPITLRATATGGSNIKYQFWQYNPYASTTWTQLQAYSASATCTWLPTTSSNYLLVATAEDSSVGTTVSASLWYGISIGPPLEAVMLSISPASPQPAYTPITLTATTAGGMDISYSFWQYYPNATPAWKQLQATSSQATCSWTPIYSGSYLLSVTAQDGSIGTTTNTATWYTVQ